MKRVVLFFGTRPEAIKMAPVHAALAKVGGIEPLVVATGQHREQLAHALSLFDLPVERNLDVMTARQELPDLVARLSPLVRDALRDLRPDYALVHGDTLTTFVCAWMAFLEGIPVGHVEAGLRSHDLARPFPEEANRRLTDVLTDLALAPTPHSAENLRREGTDAARIVVTGQTGVDAVLEAASRAAPPPDLPPGPYVTVTLHRRETWPRLAEIAGALADVAHANPAVPFVFPLHLNPRVREAVRPALAGLPNVRLLDALPYGPMAALLRRSRLVVTDSGGLQEEGAALGVPVAVARDVTERPEGLATGSLVLAGTDPARVRHTVGGLLADPARLAAMARARNPFGDGLAGGRVAAAVAWRLGLGPRPADWIPPV